jgi:hypothetical protein
MKAGLWHEVMRITGLDLDADPPKRCDAEDLLERRTSDPDRVSAARWQMLLALVRVLRAEGSHPEAWGFLLGRELQLYPGNADNPESVRVWADWPDYGPVRDGIPVMHYRLQVKRRGATRTRDARASSAEEAGRIIQEAFGWLR